MGVKRAYENVSNEVRAERHSLRVLACEFGMGAVGFVVGTYLYVSGKRHDPSPTQDAWGIFSLSSGLYLMSKAAGHIYASKRVPDVVPASLTFLTFIGALLYGGFRNHSYLIGVIGAFILYVADFGFDKWWESKPVVADLKRQEYKEDAQRQQRRARKTKKQNDKEQARQRCREAAIKKSSARSDDE